MEPEFTRNLLIWDQSLNKREMPWKGERNPYRIWISEIILQQTRVEQGWSYYERFTQTYPTIQQLAAADDREVFKLWEGLGYYSRCRNLLETARHISFQLDGIFPASYNELLKLKGVGPYTAAAIASFAFGECVPVVDGNVLRVLSRYFGISEAVDTNSGKTRMSLLARSVISATEPARYNQAIMDFGATICKPKQPLCGSCPQRGLCRGYLDGTYHLLPVKEKALKRRSRWFNYFIVRHEGRVYIRKRAASDIWQNLHEFILFESEGELNGSVIKVVKQLTGLAQFNITAAHKRKPQQLTHQTVYGSFYLVDSPEEPLLRDGYIPVDICNLHVYAFPKMITSFLSEHRI